MQIITDATLLGAKTETLTNKKDNSLIEFQMLTYMVDGEIFVTVWKGTGKLKLPENFPPQLVKLTIKIRPDSQYPTKTKMQVIDFKQ